jgi:acyl carrier protein
VKIRGYRIELAEVEAALAAESSLAQAAVVVQGDPRRGNQLVAYLVPAGVALPDPATLRRTLAARLPDYMIPAAFVVLDALPLTSNGKVDRRALAARHQSTRSSGAFEEPRGMVEKRLAAIWSELLGVESIGRLDDFFALGGHSLLAMRVPSRVRDAFGIELAIRDLFEARTLADLAVVAQALLLQSGRGDDSGTREEFEEVDL